MVSEGHRSAKLTRWPCGNVDIACSAEAPLYSADVDAKIGGGNSKLAWPASCP